MNSKSIPLLILLFMMVSVMVYAQSDGLPRGAHQMPYKRYEATTVSLGGGATLLGPTFDQKKVESEASDQICASLNATNSSVKWNLTQAAQGLVLRFSMPDGAGGGGQNGSLALYVNGTFVQNINLSSKWAWQYFSPNPGDGTKDPTNSPSSGWTARMRFDEVRVKLASSIASGAEVKLQKTSSDGINYLVDFIEMEPIPAAVGQPANYINVTSKGAVPNDAVDDMQAFSDAIGEARTTGKSIYVPAGRFLLSRKLDLININNVTIQGAGMWHTELYFTNPSPGNGGIETGGTGMHMKDFFMNTENTTRALPYKGFTGGYGTNSTIERVWAEHFECGAWIANWSGPSTAQTDGLLITESRFRNNYADGVNFSKGTSNSICEHSSFRNNGDDAMASWSSFDGPACLNNEFRYCTAENTWRAAGIGFFGGGGHKGHHLLIKDGIETGIRVNSDFQGVAFSTDRWMEISETTVISCGTNANLWYNRYGAVDIFTRLYNLQNLRLRNVDILNSQKDAIMIYTVNPSYTITNLELINVTVDGAGKDNNINNYTSGTYDDYAGHGLLVLPNVNGSMTTQNLLISDAPTAAISNESSATFTINTIGNVAVTGVGISPTSAISIPQGGTSQLTAN
ncbi:MAG TPA: glycosyl hydrolase family 28-related protein, partial [Cytophagales bacterium]|nr:glycosyl hydrolase family 28-related protein [Cytophagales bacterium]